VEFIWKHSGKLNVCDRSNPTCYLPSVLDSFNADDVFRNEVVYALSMTVVYKLSMKDVFMFADNYDTEICYKTFATPLNTIIGP